MCQKPKQIRKAAVNKMKNNSMVAIDATSSNNSNNGIMENVSSIITLDMLHEKGIKIGRLAGNRTLDDKIIKAKKKSLQETGLLIPAVIVEADKAVAEGLEVVDFETGELVTKEKAMSYVVLVDANHRYSAHLKLVEEDENYHGDFFFMYPMQDISVTKMLSEINIATNPWKTADYGKGAAMMIKDDLPLLNAINKLTEKGYSIEAACKWLTFESKVTKSILVKAMNNEIDDALKNCTNIKNGESLLEAAKESFSEDFLRKRTLPDWIISKMKDSEEGKSAFIKKMCSFLKSFNRSQSDDIENCKGTRGGDTKETIVNRKLNALWEKKQ